jgi:uncharacterized protein (TIGR02996 family)
MSEHPGHRMPSDAEPFLQRIRAFPDDDAQRLIYADWLEEQGGRDADRAAFIRIQVALAGMPADDVRRPGLLVAERDLLDAYRPEWESPVRGLGMGPVFRRGFVDEVKVAARQFLHHADELFAAGPIRHIHLIDVGQALDAVLESPFLGRLNALTVFAQHAGEALARGIARCPHLAGLQSLNLGRNRLEDDSAHHLATSPSLTNLLELDLAENDITEAGSHAIAGSQTLSNLKRLELRHNPLGPGGAEALAGSERLGGLEYLGLAGTGIGVPRLHALYRMADLLRIPALDLTGNALGPNGLKAILQRAASNTDPVPLRELDLSHNELGEAGARALAECRLLKDLRVLRLASCGITDAAARLLADSPHLNKLVALDLANNPVNDPGFRGFLDSQQLRSLRKLVVPLGVSPWMQGALEHRFHRGGMR